MLEKSRKRPLFESLQKVEGRPVTLLKKEPAAVYLGIFLNFQG